MRVVPFYNTYIILNELTLNLGPKKKNDGTVKIHCLQSNCKCKDNLAYLEQNPENILKD